MSHHDVIVIGAGPAGLSAAACLAGMGLDVVCLDEQASVGGQIYRNINGASPDQRRLLGEDYTNGDDIARRFAASGAGYEPNATVWQVDPDGHICYSRDGQSRQVKANYIIAATGAMERPMPIPGWTLPGVMGAGAANNLAKEAGLTPDGRVVLAGSGPLLLLEASLLIRKKVNIRAILETTPPLPVPKAVVRAPEAALRADFLWKGLSLVREIKKAGIPHYKGVTEIKALGGDRVNRVEARCKEEVLSFDTDMLLLHFGVIPNTHIFRQAGCDMVWESGQRYWYPRCDAWGRTSCERIFAAGDGARVGGAPAARYKGELAALEAARCSGIIPEYERDRLAAPLLKAIRKDRWPRPFVDALYAPNPRQFVFDDDTVVCRCENLTVGHIRQMVKEGVKEVNEIKTISRAGMGPCQGRMCGPAVAEIVAAETGTCPDRAGLINIRPPLKPVPLAEVADMALDQGATADNWLLGKK
ncbi:MAG: FAD-dependent oxidoreductase [Desulfobacterales bacterium]|nr:FAD-dependent oxidoreductase [Desulfobacterales bacterium]